jgi:hypothetical protein
MSGVALRTASDLVAETRAMVGKAFTAENSRRQAERDPTRLTMSGLGGCTRAAAYSIAGTPPSDVALPEEARQALLGTWIHEHLLPGMAEFAGPDVVVEQPVKLAAAGLVITGTLDMAVHDVVWEVKSVKEWRLHGVRRKGVYAEHRVQARGYGLAYLQAGNPVRWIVFIYIDRATGEVHIEAEPFTNAAALSVIDRLDRIKFHAGDDPDRAPREGRGPGVSLACDRCPWLRRCWGDDAVPGKTGPQRTIARTDAGIEYALDLYGRAAAAASQAERDKTFAKLILAAAPNGQYGSWIYGRGRGSEKWDHDQIAADYAAAGLEVPKAPTAGKIIVKPAPQK